MYIEDGVTITDSVVGPNVSIGAGSVIERSTLRDVVMGSKSTLSDCTLHDSLIGDDVTLAGVNGSVTIGDHSEVRTDA